MACPVERELEVAATFADDTLNVILLWEQNSFGDLRRPSLRDQRVIKNLSSADSPEGVVDDKRSFERHALQRGRDKMATSVARMRSIRQVVLRRRIRRERPSA